MTELRAAARQVLDTCGDVVNGWQSLAPLSVRQAASESLDALRAALEQPVQPPCEIAEDGVCERIDCCGNPTRSEPLTVLELQQALVDVDLVDRDAIDDPEGFDDGLTLQQIDALHQALKEKNP